REGRARRKRPDCARQERGAGGSSGERDEGEFELSVVVVSWNVRNLLARCLAALPAAIQAADEHATRSTQPVTSHSALGTRRSALGARHSALAWEVIVVDNASTDGSPAMVAERFPGVRLIETGANLGFARGVNAGLRASRGRHVAVLTPDTEPGPGSLATLVRYLDAHPAVGLAGPRLRYPDGTTQPSRRRFPTLATACLESTFLQDWFPNSRAVRRYYVADRSDDESQPVDWLVGAALVVRPAAHHAVGGP